MSEREANTAWRFGLGAVALWSTVATAFKFSLNYLTPAELLWVATQVSWLFLALVVAITGEWRDWRTVPPRTIGVSLVAGLLNPTLYYLLLFAAYDRLPAQEAMAINYSWALTLALLAGLVFRQQIGWPQWLAAAVSYLGVLLIATRGELLAMEFDNPVGVALAVASTGVWSVYWLINTKLPIPPISGLFFNFSGGLLATTAVIGIEGFRALPMLGLAGGAYVGFFEMGLSFLLWLIALRRTRNTLRTSTLIFLSPPLSLLLIAWVLGEPIKAATLTGLGLILAGLAMQQLYRLRR